MSGFQLDFEKPILEIDRDIKKLKYRQEKDGVDLSRQILELENKLHSKQQEIFASLTPWQRVQLARHPKRPYTLDFIEGLFTDFIEVHGDRNYRDDKALIAGFASFKGQSVCVMGQQKGRETTERIERNFSMMHPEGYRKALRVMKLAEKFRLPVIIFVDTIGAYPGIGAEERGQAEAIARNLLEMTTLEVPIVVSIIGEGASGGALGIGMGDRILMLENAWYSVISPEGCAAILWRDRKEAPRSAEALKLTAKDLLELKMIDEIIPEGQGAAHFSPAACFENLGSAIERHLEEIKKFDIDKLLEIRYNKYRQMGKFRQVQRRGKNG